MNPGRGTTESLSSNLYDQILSHESNWACRKVVTRTIKYLQDKLTFDGNGRQDTQL